MTLNLNFNHFIKPKVKIKKEVVPMNLHKFKKEILKTFRSKRME